MSRRLLPHPVLSILLLLTWMLLMNSFSPGTILVGAVLGIAIPWMTTDFWPDRPRLVRPAVLLTLVPRVLWDILVANIVVARLVLFRPSDQLRPTFVRIDLDIQNPYGIIALASIITLTPGTVSSKLSENRRVLHVHALDCPDPEALVADIRRCYERPLKELLEC